MDVRKLTQEPSGKVRSMLAAKIAIDYRSGNFSSHEAAIADDIFRILIKDVEKSVRKTISEQLCHCPTVPHDIIMKLAQDETEVAVPVLEYSSVLSEQDLIALVQSTKDAAKWCAIARRESLSEALCNNLMGTHNHQVFGNLFKNRSAVLAERTLLEAWDEISNESPLLELLVNRGGLPMAVAEKLFHAVSEEMKRHLAKTYKIGLPVAHKAANDAREWEVLGLVPTGEDDDPNKDEKVEDLIDQLQSNGRLTHSLLIRAICTGNLNIFEAGIAKLAGVPRVNARVLLLDGGALGFHAIYEAAGMPAGFAEAIHVLLRISLEETDFGLLKRQDFRKRVIDRIFIEGHQRKVENMEYLLSIIGGKVATDRLH